MLPKFNPNHGELELYAVLGDLTIEPSHWHTAFVPQPCVWQMACAHFASFLSCPIYNINPHFVHINNHIAEIGATQKAFEASTLLVALLQGGPWMTGQGDNIATTPYNIATCAHAKSFISPKFIPTST